MPPPRVLIVMPDQWPRALLRAGLREVGYDAVGARDLVESLGSRPVEPDRGPVRLLVVDQDAIARADDALLTRLLARHPDAAAVLLSRATRAPPPGPWRRVVRRPASIADLVSAVQDLLPLPPESRRPVDD